MIDETNTELVQMARAAKADERLSDGALYGKLADRLEEADELLHKIKTLILPKESGFATPPEMRHAIYDRLVEMIYPQTLS